MPRIRKLKGAVQSKLTSFEWKIQKFFGDCPYSGNYYMSPKFSVQYANVITEWHLHIEFPIESKEEYKDCMLLRLRYNSDEKMKVSFDYRFSITSERANSLRVGPEVTKSSESHLGESHRIQQSVIKDPKNGLLINDTLTILCEIMFHPPKQDVTKSLHDYDEWLNKIGKGFGDYEQLLGSNNFADVTFNVKGKKIDAHKAILSCRNPVFKAMFDHEMKENEQSAVDIVDVDYDVMNELFRFIYSGKVKNIEKIAGELFVAADKYQVIGLKALCEKTIYDNLTVDNTVEYLKLTEMWNTMNLKRLLIQYVADNYKIVVKKPGFEDLHNKLLHRIMLAVADRIES